MMHQPKKTYTQLARMKYGGTSDPLAETRFKDENDNLLALITRNVFSQDQGVKVQICLKQHIGREGCGMSISIFYQELNIR